MKQQMYGNSETGCMPGIGQVGFDRVQTWLDLVAPMMTVETSGFLAHHAIASCARLHPSSSAIGFNESTLSSFASTRFCSAKLCADASYVRGGCPNQDMFRSMGFVPNPGFHNHYSMWQAKTCFSKLRACFADMLERNPRTW